MNPDNDSQSDRKLLVELVFQLDLAGPKLYRFLDDDEYDYRTYRNTLYDPMYLYNEFAPRVSMEELSFDMDKLNEL